MAEAWSVRTSKVKGHAVIECAASVSTHVDMTARVSIRCHALTFLNIFVFIPTFLHRRRRRHRPRPIADVQTSD